MASSRSLGTLTVNLVAEVAGFVRGMDQSERAAAKWRRQIEKDVRQASREAQARLKGISVAVAGAVAGLTAMTVVGLRNVDAQAKLARSLDTTYDSVTALQMAFGDAGIDNFEASMNRLNRRLGAAELGRGSALKAVEELNLNLQELSGLEVDERLARIADRIQEVSDNSQQAARYAQDLGFEQREAAQFFLQGGDAIREYRKEVDQFGLALSAIETARVEQANDALGIMGDAAQMVQQRLAVGLAPAVTRVADHITESFRESADTMQSDMDRAIHAAVGNFAEMVDASATVLEAIQDNPISAQFGVLGWLLLGPKGALIGAAIGATFDIIQEGMARVGIGISDAEDNARRLINIQEQIAQQEQIIAKAREIGHDENSRFITEAQDQLAELLEVQSGLQAEVEASTEAQDKYNELLNRGTDRASGFAGALRGLAGSLRDIDWVASDSSSGGGFTGRTGQAARDAAEAVNELEDALANMRAEFDPAFAEFNRYADQIDLIEQFNISAAEKEKLREDAFAEHQRRMAAIADEGNEKYADYAQVRQRLDSQILSSATQMAGNIAGSIAQMVGEESDAYRAAFLAQQGFAIATSVINTQMAAAAALAPPPIGLGPVAGAPYAGMIEALGAANVGIIAAQTLTGMAHDGIDSVPQTGTWLLEKGERVMTSETSKKLDQKLEGGSGVVVNLYEDASKAGQVQQDQRDDGTTEVNVFVSDIMSNGPRAKAMQRAYGLRRQGT